MVLFYFCILATERVVWQVNMCILQKFEPLPNHYLYWGDALVYFWEMDTITVLQMFWKKEIVYVGTCKTKLYGKSRNGVSFNRLACNRQKETLFLMPYYWDMKGWRATVSCRLDCAIKNGTASCGYKSQPLSARQTKKSPWQYSLEAFQGIPPRIFLAVP